MHQITQCDQSHQSNDGKLVREVAPREGTQRQDISHNIFQPHPWTYAEHRQRLLLVGSAYSSDAIGDGPSIWTDPPMYPVSPARALSALEIVLQHSVEFTLAREQPPWLTGNINAAVQLARRTALGQQPYLDHIHILTRLIGGIAPADENEQAFRVEMKDQFGQLFEYAKSSVVQAAHKKLATLMFVKPTTAVVAPVAPALAVTPLPLSPPATATLQWPSALGPYLPPPAFGPLLPPGFIRVHLRGRMDHAALRAEIITRRSIMLGNKRCLAWSDVTESIRASYRLRQLKRDLASRRRCPTCSQLPVPQPGRPSALPS